MTDTYVTEQGAGVRLPQHRLGGLPSAAGAEDLHLPGPATEQALDDGILLVADTESGLELCIEGVAQGPSVAVVADES